MRKQFDLKDFLLKYHALGIEEKKNSLIFTNKFKNQQNMIKKPAYHGIMLLTSYLSFRHKPIVWGANFSVESIDSHSVKIPLSLEFSIIAPSYSLEKYTPLKVIREIMALVQPGQMVIAYPILYAKTHGLATKYYQQICFSPVFIYEIKKSKW